MDYAIVESAPALLVLTFGRAHASDNAADGSAYRTVFAHPLPTTHNPVFGGNGHIDGTVAQKATPTNAPLRRKVLLLQEQTGCWVGSTWSNATDGSYRFDGLDASKTYTVISYDHTQDFRAVIADRLTPTAVPL